MYTNLQRPSEVFREIACRTFGASALQAKEYSPGKFLQLPFFSEILVVIQSVVYIFKRLGGHFVAADLFVFFLLLFFCFHDGRAIDRG